ncbi:hypothetical protein [uncultured Tolumonas sp.]|uniref:hypothetical protein n=1 Tax=uncultured Tolumonas sp. TaxID=263765 RepID=UPI002A0A29E1|nr:hypothetical protein [uncultured Tolumonas sp.]
MARPRKKTNGILPEHLYFDARRGTYRIRLINGVMKNIGPDRNHAINIANEYNLRARSRVVASVTQLLMASGSSVSSSAMPLSAHIDRIIERIIKDESPTADAVSTLKNDAHRAIEYFSEIPGDGVTLNHVNDYLDKYHSDASANVKNRKISWLKKLFSYAMDEGVMNDNPAARKRPQRVDEKRRHRLKAEWYKAIHSIAPTWLRTAMDLALQTTHARLEISRVRYSLKEPGKNRCGCVWFDEPRETVFGLIYGTLYIHRQKVKDKEAAHVAIPIGGELKRIIDDSKDKIVSAYVVHRMPEKRSNPLSKEVSHITQVSPDYISRSFSKYRDMAGCCNHIPPDERPTFHEIRALAAHLFVHAGINPQARMAHSDAKSTKVYTKDHVDWVEVPHAEIKA